MTVQSTDIVVDTSVARAAGESDHPVSSACRRFLAVLRDGRIDLVMTDDLRLEWKRHRSTYTATWLVSMFARKRIRPDRRSAPWIGWSPAGPKRLPACSGLECVPGPGTLIVALICGPLSSHGYS